jgi:hypothetical protein
MVAFRVLALQPVPGREVRLHKPMVAFRVLYCIVILRHSDRKILQVNVTAHPSAEGTAHCAGPPIFVPFV